MMKKSHAVLGVGALLAAGLITGCAGDAASGEVTLNPVSWFNDAEADRGAQDETSPNASAKGSGHTRDRASDPSVTPGVEAGAGDAGDADGKTSDQSAADRRAKVESGEAEAAARRSERESAEVKGLVEPGTRFAPGDAVKSPNGKYTLGQQPDGNFVLLDSSDKAVWSTQTHGNPGAYTRFNHDGNLVTYTAKGEPLFESVTKNVGTALAVQDDGNAVVYGAKAVWASKTQVSRIYPGQRLRPNQSRTSPDGRYRLQQLGDGNLVVLNGSNKAIWSSQTHGNPGAYTVMQTNGNLVVFSAAGKSLWWSASSDPNAFAHMNVDGNLVVVRPDGKGVWGSSTTRHQLLRGQQLRAGQDRWSVNRAYRLDQYSDGNLVIQDAAQKVIWATGTHGNPGAYTVFQGDGNVVVASASGRPLWST
ncbi:hypothetical protein [Actinopolymorpha alba]|uniref:hypothetical protein n=1 Tax=Actinopolymorpha alba TaxID=533267 RepID=UPI00036E30C3|nr:hypothetical protein [Actinopolymorpha alba]